MARSIDLTAARALLVEAFRAAEENSLGNRNEPIPSDLAAETKRAFSSNTRAYRQALLGCVIVHAIDPLADIRSPHTDHGDDAFSGRTLDEGVVIPFLEEQGIATMNAYLSSLRRGVRFIEGATGQRDRAGFSALVSAVDAVAQMSPAETLQYLRYLLGLFVEFREQAGPPVPAQIRAPIKVAWDDDDILVRIEVTPESPNSAKADGRLANYDHLQEEVEELSAVLAQNNAAIRISITLSRYQKVLGHDFTALDIVRLGLVGISLHHAVTGSQDALGPENLEQLRGFLVAHDLFVSKDEKWVEYRRAEATPTVGRGQDLAALPTGQQIVESLGQLAPFMETSITEVLSESRELSTEFAEEPLLRDGFWKSLGNVLIAIFEKVIAYARTDIKGFAADFASDLRRNTISKGSKTLATLIVTSSVAGLSYLADIITGYHWIGGALQFLKMVVSKVL